MQLALKQSVAPNKSKQLDTVDVTRPKQQLPLEVAPENGRGGKGRCLR